MAVLDQRRYDIAVIDDALSDADLATLEAALDGAAFEPQDLGRGAITRRERAELDDRAIADLLWRRLRSLLAPMAEWFDGGPGTPRLDPPLSHWVAIGCNPRSRVYRYGKGAGFTEHEDEPWKPDRTTRSMLTVLVYLPTGVPCIGGETVVDGETVEVRDGRVVVFDHGLLHEGRPVEDGHKLVLRNDIVAKPR